MYTPQLGTFGGSIIICLSTTSGHGYIAQGLIRVPWKPNIILHFADKIVSKIKQDGGGRAIKEFAQSYIPTIARAIRNHCTRDTLLPPILVYGDHGF